MKLFVYWSVFAVLTLGVAPQLQAADLTVAVASNFTAPMRELAAAFKTDSGNKLVPSFGASGTLFAQIKNGAPFAVFMSADQTFTQKAIDEGLAVKGTEFTYAIGKLVLWSPISGMVDEKGEILKTGVFKHLAIGNPELAPYGRAAKETMDKLGLWDSLEPRIVQGENITQTFEFVSTGNAEIGFVALSQVEGEGSKWVVPQEMYTPIKQDAVLLKKGKESAAAKSFIKFLKSEKARKIISGSGYTLPSL